MVQLAQRGRRRAGQARASSARSSTCARSSPLDEDTILESVESTGRLVVRRRGQPALQHRRRHRRRMVAQEALRRPRRPRRRWSRRRTRRCRSRRCWRTSTSRAPSRSPPRCARSTGARRGRHDGRIAKLIMPKWGLSMTEGRLVDWLVEEGAEIAVGDEVVEVETEKITDAVESPVAGRPAPPRRPRRARCCRSAAARRDRRRRRAGRRDRRLRGRVPGDVRARRGRGGRRAAQPETVEVGAGTLRYLRAGEGDDAGRAPARLRRRPRQLAVQPRRAGRGPRASRARPARPRRLRRRTSARATSLRSPTRSREFLDALGARARRISSATRWAARSPRSWRCGARSACVARR